MVDRVVSTATVSRPAAAIILLIFSAVVVTCVLLPTKSLIELVGQISAGAISILINKGVFYLLGAGVALSFLLLDGVYNTLIRRPIPAKLKKLVSVAIFSGVGLVLILPPAVHYVSAYVLEQRGYRVCDSASSQWLFVRDIVYAAPGTCD
ncbi:hypothetical protein [Microbulbifer pacificus]|uniref:hypothetical protein n=1 Tax=Microbulbifer pacificus TaxID=407164 RepID=UPI000CF513A2|nr:hypothetical protein [Microbulbifer pacificus]